MTITRSGRRAVLLGAMDGLVLNMGFHRGRMLPSETAIR